MPSAPYINYYELFEDQPSEDRGILLRPDGFFAITTCIGYHEKWFLNVESEEMTPFQDVYRKYSTVDKDSLALFEWFTHCCSQSGSICDEPSWQKKANQFSPTARTFMTTMYLHPFKYSNHDLVFLGSIMKMFTELTERDKEEWDVPDPLYIRVARFFLRPFFWTWDLITRNKDYIWENEYTRKTAEKGIEEMKKVTELCQSFLEDNRSFTFEQPEDQIEETMDLDGMTIRKTKDGGIAFG